MESRLELISPNLVKKLSQADEKILQRITSKVCEIALRQTDINSPLINQFKESENVEGTTLIDRSSLRQELKSYIDQLDEIQWDLKEQVDSGSESLENYLQAFCNARVINALYYALDANPYLAAAESIYEANAATNNLRELEDAIEVILREET